MRVSQKWRNIAAGLVLSIATVGAVSTVASTPSQAADVGFGISVREHDRDYRDGRYHHRYHDRYWERRAAWRHEQYLRAREREHERYLERREHERWERRHGGW
jgi:hypothetical protein